MLGVAVSRACWWRYRSHALRLQLADERQQVLERASQAINGPRGDGVEIPACDTLEQLIERGSFLAAIRAGYSVILADLHYCLAMPL